MAHCVKQWQKNSNNVDILPFKNFTFTKNDDIFFNIVVKRINSQGIMLNIYNLFDFVNDEIQLFFVIYANLENGILHTVAVTFEKYIPRQNCLQHLTIEIGFRIFGPFQAFRGVCSNLPLNQNCQGFYYSPE